MSGKRKKIVAFLCNWCTYTAADLAGTSRLKYEPDLRILRVMCSSRVDPVFILKALMDGADGVLVGGCELGDCHYQKGNYYARRKVAVAKKIAADMGLDPDRIRLSWISASDGPRFAEVVNEFTREIEEKGDTPVKNEAYV